MCFTELTVLYIFGAILRRLPQRSDIFAIRYSLQHPGLSGRPQHLRVSDSTGAVRGRYMHSPQLCPEYNRSARWWRHPQRSRYACTRERESGGRGSTGWVLVSCIPNLRPTDVLATFSGRIGVDICCRMWEKPQFYSVRTFKSTFPASYWAGPTQGYLPIRVVTYHIGVFSLLLEIYYRRASMQ